MVDAPLEKKTGAEDVTWDLSVYYDSTKMTRALIKTLTKQRLKLRNL